MNDLPRLSHVIQTLGVTCAETSGACVNACQALQRGDARSGVDNLKHALKLARQAASVGNLLADVLEAMETSGLADGDAEGAMEAVGERA